MENPPPPLDNFLDLPLTKIVIYTWHSPFHPILTSQLSLKPRYMVEFLSMNFRIFLANLFNCHAIAYNLSIATKVRLLHGQYHANAIHWFVSILLFFLAVNPPWPIGTNPQITMTIISQTIINKGYFISY